MTRPRGFAVTGSEFAREAGKKGGRQTQVLKPGVRWSPEKAAEMSKKAVEARKAKMAIRKEAKANADAARLLGARPKEEP